MGMILLLFLLHLVRGNDWCLEDGNLCAHYKDTCIADVERNDRGDCAFIAMLETEIKAFPSYYRTLKLGFKFPEGRSEMVVGVKLGEPDSELKPFLVLCRVAYPPGNAVCYQACLDPQNKVHLNPRARVDAASTEIFEREVRIALVFGPDLFSHHIYPDCISAKTDFFDIKALKMEFWYPDNEEERWKAVSGIAMDAPITGLPLSSTTAKPLGSAVPSTPHTTPVFPDAAETVPHPEANDDWLMRNGNEVKTRSADVAREPKARTDGAGRRHLANFCRWTPLLLLLF